MSLSERTACVRRDPFARAGTAHVSSIALRGAGRNELGSDNPLLIPWFLSVKPKVRRAFKKHAAILGKGYRVSALGSFNLGHFLDLTVGVVVAFVLATLIGAERQWRQRSAGLRTNVLVAVGAAAFVSLGVHLNGNAGAAQIAAYVVSGIGFLGAGVIMKEGAHVWGLNTAATLWCSAAVGALSGVGLPAEAAVLTIAVLAGNTLLRPLVNAINRAPLDEQLTEATYEVHVVTAPETVGEARDLVTEALEAASYPVGQIEVEQRSAKASELIATLISTSVDPKELDAVAAALERSPLVTYASWTSESGEHG
jgi:putative Mg2+ transporter-C (MgtC) family protein